MEPDIIEPVKIYVTVEENLNYFKNMFGEGMNLVESRHQILGGKMPVGLAYIDTIADKKVIMQHVLKPILECKDIFVQNPAELPQLLDNQLIHVAEIKQIGDLSQATASILNGDTLLFINGISTALVVGTRKTVKRAVEPPENEATVMGSQESFTDDLKTNCDLIIKRLPVPNLKFEEFTLGTLTCTKTKLVWLDGIANEKVIQLARSRIQSIDIDSVDGIGKLVELIEDRPLSIFPKCRITERPDVTERNLTLGTFAIICSNSPFAIIAPISLWDNFKTMDDYQDKTVTSSYLRIVRYISFVFSILISGLYLSFVTYNQAIVPANLAIDIAQGREGVPFPSVLELLILTLSITIIREAGLRMPGSVGYFVGTLAAVVIGQAIVTAGYVSASLIIIVAISTISSFAISTTTILYPSRILNYIFIILAGFFGAFGVISGLIFLFWYLTTLESFGVPYLYPLIPYDKNGIGDVFIRPPLRRYKTRSKLFAPYDRYRIGKGKKQ